MTGRWVRYLLILTMTYSTGWAQESKGSVWANLDVQFYGYIKADASWSDSRTNPGDYVAWVDSEAGTSTSPVADDDEFNMTARETRIGLRVHAPEMEGVKPSGRVEFDFYGGATGVGTAQQDNKGLLLLRHAYLQLDHAQSGWSLLAGQTSDVVAPLNPTTLNYTVLWFAGNIGYRRAQIRLTKNIDAGQDMSLNLQGAVARTIGTAGSIASEPGADAGYPMLQGRAALTFPGLNGHDATVGLSGHWGEEEHDYMSGAQRHKAHASTWSGCVDVRVPVSDVLAMQGELYTGTNLSSFLGGIGYGVSGAGTSSVQSVQNSGGWVAASLRSGDHWNFNTGYGLSRNSTNDLAPLTSPQRKNNSCYFGNAIYDVTKHASVGVEISRWMTDYVGAADGKAWRGQISLILRN